MRTFVTAALLAVFVFAVPASAADMASLQTNVRAALRSAKSFVVEVKIKPLPVAPMGASIQWTVVAPNRFRQVTHGDPTGDDDTIIIGHNVYGNKNGAWDVQTWDDHLVTGFEADVFGVEIISVNGDGTFVMKDPLGGSDRDTLSCAYDKSTYRPVTCSNAGKTVTYGRYDDPSVTIPAPAHAKRVDQ
ncbi:MAG TPA: hypothetical protein VFE36_13640 [Candidatus Baltobacteraceae bacterium]|nr:hypothetical protein [Candidatus Baltobacteraceae bacterium]